MKRLFVRERPDHWEKTQVDMETGEVLVYRMLKEGMVYAEHKFQVEENGWSSLKEFLQKRYRYCRYADPRKGIKAPGYVEVDFEEEISREKTLLINYTATYIEGCFSTDPQQRAIQEERIQWLHNYMQRYGLSMEEAQSAVLAELKRRHVVEDPQ